MAQNKEVEIDNEEGFSNQQVQAWMLVIVQALVLLAHIAVAYASFPLPIVTYCLFVPGIGLAVWSAFLMRSSLSISPLPNNGGLVTDGPFAFIRHPIYLGLIIAMLGIQLGSEQTRSWYLFGLLIMVLFTKMKFEESELAAIYPEFAEYKKKTRKIIPYIF